MCELLLVHACVQDKDWLWSPEHDICDGDSIVVYSCLPLVDRLRCGSGMAD